MQGLYQTFFGTQNYKLLRQLRVWSNYLSECIPLLNYLLNQYDNSMAPASSETFVSS